jgi:glycosyltransferase involved in cell wall biosynthesis
MKLLVYSHQLDIGGAEFNAIDLAAALREFHSYKVVLCATPGPLVTLLEEKRVPYIPAPRARYRPFSPSMMQALRAAVREHRPDLIHAWDWWQGIDAFYALHLPMRIPLIVSDMTMRVTRLLPRELPTTFGTPQLVSRAKALGRQRVDLLLPPIDVHRNAPGVVDAQPFRDQFSIADTDIALVTVSRLAESLKQESLFRTLEAMRVLGRTLPVRFLLVGDGALRSRLERSAQTINCELGRPAITLTGPMVDPRPAYAAADIVIGMGSSALRAMAFAKPVIVVGEQGFSKAFCPDTAEFFYHAGMYGLGNNDPGNAQLIATVSSLIQQFDKLQDLGLFSRDFVVKHFSLEAVSARFAGFCRHTVETDSFSWPTALLEGARTAAVYVRERRFLVPYR